MYLRKIAFLTISLLCVYGCGQDSVLVGDSTAPLEIGFQLAPSAPAQSNITRVELTVSTPDIDEPLFFPIVNINQADRTASDLIRVPISESVTFSVRAFEGDCPALSGLVENVNITSDRTAPLIIRLSPMPIIISLRSQQEQLSVGSRYEVEVHIEDAPRLTAFTCELEFDENLLEPLEAVPGDFFGNDALFIEDSEFQRRSEGQISLGITLKGNNTGICGSGVVFRVAFQTASGGNAAVAVVDNVVLITSDFEQMEDSARIRIEPAIFVIIE